MSAKLIAVSMVGLTTTVLPFHVTGTSFPFSKAHGGKMRRYPEPSETA